MNAPRLNRIRKTTLNFFGILTLSTALLQASDSVLPGWDLFITDSASTSFGGANFEGVPLTTFDFGGTIGMQNVGSTDTIVERLATAIDPVTVVPIELVALQLRSVTPVDFGLGTDFYFVTLQSARGGPTSAGDMTINFGPEGDPHGTFDSLLNVFFDIRMGGLNGPIAISDTVVLQSFANPWGHNAPAGVLTIPGVNFELNGVDISQDFWGVPDHTGPHGIVHSPEPHHYAALFAAGLLGFGLFRRYHFSGANT